MSSPTQISHYVCVIEGDYIARDPHDPKKKMLKPYQVSINVPDLGTDKGDGQYLGTVLHESPGKPAYLTKALRAKYPDAVTYRTHEFVSREYVTSQGTLQPSKPPTPRQKKPSSMNKLELTEYIEKNALPIDLEIYSTVDKMRRAIIEHAENPTKFIETQTKKREEIEFEKNFAALNDLPATPSTDTPVSGEESDDDSELPSEE